MNSILIDKLRQINPTGSGGFEELIAKLLEALTGRRFDLAKSGTQQGRDMSMRHADSNVIAVECKRYGPRTKLNERELLGEVVQAVETIPDLDLWVLVASRDVPSQLQEALHRATYQRGVDFRSISSGDGVPSSLELLCAEAPQIVITYLGSKLSATEKQTLRQELKQIAASPQFREKVDQIRRDFLSPLIGYDNWRVERNQSFVTSLQSERESRAHFGQPLNVEEDGVKLIHRQAAWAQLDEWFSGWDKDKAPFVLLGEEGDGKTWGVASWLSQKIQRADKFPAVLFLSSTHVESNEPLALLSRLLPPGQQSWQKEYSEKRLNRWMSQSVSDAPVMLLVLDGINERRQAGWWRTLLEKLAASPWHEHIAVLITCRTAYWQRHFAHLRHLEAKKIVLSPYNDDELDHALAYHNLRRSHIGTNLLPLIRKPRYFDLTVRLRERVAESGDVTVARLIYEDWRDRLQRKRQLPLDDETFQGLICDLARQSQEGNQYFREQDVERMLPSFLDNQAIIEELRTGGILQSKKERYQSKRGRYQVNERLLIHGFGLLLVDQLEEESATSEKELAEVVAGWLEPHAEMDIKAAICGFAALHALSLREFSAKAKVALLWTWLNTRNPKQEIEEEFLAYLPLDPQCYIEVAEIVWSEASQNFWVRKLFMHSFLQWYKKSPRVATELRSAFNRWLGFVDLYYWPYMGGPTAEQTEKVRREIYDRIGYELKPGSFMFAGHSLTAIEDEGLLRLGRVALAVISHQPRAPFVRAIATACVAEVIMGHPGKYKLLAWIIRTAREPVWVEIRKEVQELLAVDHLVAKRAASRLLSFEGSEEAYQLKQTFAQGLFPPNSFLEEHKNDPCNSGFAWSKEECEKCLQRSDLEAQWIARRVKPFCVNPNLSVPDDIGERLAPLAETIDVRVVSSLLAYTSDDHSLEKFEPALCAYAPNAYAHLVRRLVRQTNERQGFALRQLSRELIKYHLIFNQEEKNSIYKAWQQLFRQSDSWGETEEYIEMDLFQLVLKSLDAEEQLFHLLKRPHKALDLLRYEPSFLPITHWEVVSQELTKASDTNTIRRILWFLSLHPDAMPEKIIHEQILPLLNHEESVVRAYTLKTIWFSHHSVAIKAVVDGEWAWHEEHGEVENRWGSLLLCQYGTTLPYSELRCRVHPIYLGYAVRCRGMDTSEVHQYAEDIHQLWLRLGTEVPDLPTDFPPTEVNANMAEEVMMNEHIELSQSVFSKSITYMARHASWWAIKTGNPEDTFNSSDLNSHKLSRQKQSEIMHKTLEQQIKANNFWFARYFYTDALEQILHQRPDLISQWLEAAFVERTEAYRRLRLGKSFYEALCKMLLRHQPNKGVSLYWRLQDVGSFVRVVDGKTKIRFLDYALFKAPPTTEIKEAWKRKLEECQTDRELMEIAILSQYGKGHEWLWSYVKEGMQSTSPLQKSRSMTLLAFVDREEALHLLTRLLEELPETWFKNKLEVSLQRWQKNAWAKHWFRRFLGAEDEVIAWASFRLFLQCADTRFWYWQKEVEAEVDASRQTKKRREFLQDNLSSLKKSIDKNEKALKEQFLVHKVQKNQAWPWM